MSMMLRSQSQIPRQKPSSVRDPGLLTEAHNVGEQIAAFLDKQTRTPGASVSALSHRPVDPADVDTDARRLLATSSPRSTTPQPSAGPALESVAPLGRDIERDLAARGTNSPISQIPDFVPELRTAWRTGLPVADNQSRSPDTRVRLSASSAAAQIVDIDAFLREI